MTKIDVTPIEYYVQQVRECCTCFECASADQWGSAVATALESWGNLTCGNWIDEHEIKVRIPLSKECGNCCPNIYTINLPEYWIQVDSITVEIREFFGLEMETKELKTLYDDATHDLLVDLSDEIDCCNCCTKYDLLVSYTVGTSVIPLELCKWFCSITQVYLKLSEVECASCGDLDNVTIVEVDGMKDLSASIKRMAVDYFSKVVEKYLLCELKLIKDWTVVV